MFAGLFALAAIAALVVGVPFALYTFFGSPIPRSMPSLGVLTQRLDTQELLRVLIDIVWLAWLQLAVCVLVELYAGARGIAVPARVPLAGGPQAVAHRLVVAALLLFTTTTAVVPILTAARTTHIQRLDHDEPVAPHAAHAEHAEHAEPAARAEPGPAPVTKNPVRKIYRVRPSAGRHHESLWEIAEKCLGDGRRYRDIYALNKGRLQPDGTRLTMASLIRPGWVLDMPADATHVEIVERGAPDVPRTPGGDHHRANAEKQAIEAARRAAREEAREDRAEREAGKPPVDRGPNIPTPPSDHGSPPAERAPVPPSDHGSPPAERAPGVPAPSPDRRVGAPPTERGPDTPAPSPDRRAPAEPSPGSSAPSSPDRGSPPAEGPDRLVSRPVLDWPQELALASLLAAGLLAALGRRRRQQLWGRAFGTMIARPQGEAAIAEQALRIGADDAATRLLDLGLRQLSKELAAEGRTPPTVYAAHLGAGGIDLWIAQADPDPPAPWQALDDGQVWRLDANAELPAAELADVLAPYPGLISIGTDLPQPADSSGPSDAGRILVDLEAAHGLIAVRGPEEARRAVLAAVACELATNRWSDHMRITLVGFGEELSLVAPDRIRTVGTLAEALPELEGRAEEVRRALAASGADSVLTGRCRGVFGEAWMPHYLIMAEPPAPDEVERLLALARTGRRMASGYLVAGDVPGATWTWEVTSNGRLRAGALGLEVEGHAVPEQHYRAVVELFRAAGDLDGVAYAPLGEEPSAALGQASAHIRLLGPVQVDAPGAVEEARRELCTEVLVYLATHPDGVHPTVLGGAVWPRGVSASVRDATVARVGDWLGQDSRGRPNLYHDDRGRLRLGSEVRVDWEVFRWFVWRSAAEPGSELAYLSNALKLVRGELLEGRPRGRYGWLAAEDLEYEAAARVADIAHRVVLMRLDEGEAPEAVRAARAGLRLAPADEGLWRDLLRATHAAGDAAALREVVEEMRGHAAADPFADQLQPETEALADELLPQWRAVVAGEAG